MARWKWWIQAWSQVSCQIDKFRLKADCSYAPGVVPASEAAKAGYGQILWLSGEDHTLTEVCCFAINQEYAKLTLRSEQ
jgi:hypothetical protein